MYKVLMIGFMLFNSSGFSWRRGAACCEIASLGLVGMPE